MFNKYKKLIIGIIVIVAIFFAYSQFFGTNSGEDSLLTSNVSQSQQPATDVLGADIIRAIDQISSLDLDKSVFENPVMRQLVDRSEQINPEPIGRDNPFAPFNPSAVATQNDESDSDDEAPNMPAQADESAQPAETTQPAETEQSDEPTQN